MTKLNLIAVISALVLCIAAYFTGRSDGTRICSGDAAKVYQKGVKNDARIDKSVQRLAEPDLDRALSYWVRG